MVSRPSPRRLADLAPERHATYVRSLDADPTGKRTKGKRLQVEGADLRDADLAGRDLRFAIMRESNLDHVDLQGAALRSVDLTGCSMVGADLRGADLSGAVLDGVDLSGAKMDHRTVLTQVQLRGAYLEDVEMHDVDLSGAVMHESILRHCDLTGADLSGADLSAATTYATTFARATLHDTVMEATKVGACDFTDHRGTHLGTPESVAGRPLTSLPTGTPVPSRAPELGTGIIAYVRCLGRLLRAAEVAAPQLAAFGQLPVDDPLAPDRPAALAERLGADRLRSTLVPSSGLRNFDRARWSMLHKRHPAESAGARPWIDTAPDGDLNSDAVDLADQATMVGVLTDLRQASRLCHEHLARETQGDRRLEDAAMAIDQMLLAGQAAVDVLPWASTITSSHRTLARLERERFAVGTKEIIGPGGVAPLERGAVAATSLPGAELPTGLGVLPPSLAGAVLPRARLSNQTLPAGMDFSCGHFDLSELDGIVAPCARFEDASLAAVTFRAATLPLATFDGADARSADFTGAGLQGATFVGADLDGADFRGADLAGATFDAEALQRATFDPETARSIRAALGLAPKHPVGNARQARRRTADLSGARRSSDPQQERPGPTTPTAGPGPMKLRPTAARRPDGPRGTRLSF